MRRTIVAALALILPCAAIVPSGGWVARVTGGAAASALGDATEELGAEDDEASDEDDGPSPHELAELGGASPIDIPRGVVERVAITTPRAAPRPHGRATGVQAEAPALGILVRASVVRAAIFSGGRPSGSPVAASENRPAGVLLQGVSSYGTALRDGDLLIRIGGTLATSEGRVIGAVSGAVRSGAKAIDGEIWRAGRRIPFVVEIPRGKARKARTKKK